MATLGAMFATAGVKKAETPPQRVTKWMRLNEIELHLQQEKNPIKRRTLEKEKKKLKEKLPEIEQLKNGVR